MHDEFGLQKPHVDAAPETVMAYRQAYHARSMEAQQRYRWRLYIELRAKIRYPDCERALAAFTRVLETVGIDPWTAAEAYARREAWEDGGLPVGASLTDQENLAAAAWCNAVEAGRVELCDKEPFVSADAFRLVDFLDRSSQRASGPTFPLILQRG